MIPMNAMFRAYFSRSLQIIQNILRLIQEYARLDQNVLNDTHECYVLSGEKKMQNAKFGILLTYYELAAAAGHYYFGRLVPFTTAQDPLDDLSNAWV